MALSNQVQVSIAGASPINWVPASGQVKLVATANTFKSQDPCPTDTCDYNSGFNGTGFNNITDAFSGGIDAPDFGALGSILIHGGGHNDYGGNEVYRLDLNTLLWSRLDSPSTGVDSFNLTPASGFWNQYLELSDGQPGSAHTYANLAVIPPSHGGGVNGTLVRPISQAVGAGGSPPNTGWAHAFTLSNPSQRWRRFSVNAHSDSPLPGGACAFDPNRGRIWQITSNGSNSYGYLDVVSKIWTRASVSKSFGATTPDSIGATFDTGRDLFIAQVARYNSTSDNGVRLYYLDPDNPSGGYNRASIPGLAGVRGYWIGIDYCPDNGKYYVMVDWRNGGPWEITPSANLTDPWNCVQIPWAGTATDIAKATAVIDKIRDDISGYFGRWSYCPKVKCFVFFPYSTSSEILVFRPPGV